MVAVEILLKLIYPPPPSLFVSTMSVISVASMANAGFMEIKGKHMQYSKFWNVGDAVKNQKSSSSSDSNTITKAKDKFSARTGMIVAYAPAFLAGFASFFLIPDEGFRFALLRSALTIHFFKRLFEV